MIPALATTDWTEFKPFTALHAVTAVTMLGTSIGFALIGRRFHGTAVETFIGAFWGGLILSRMTVEIIWYMTPGNFQMHESLPLQYCDLAPWIAAIALLTRRRWARTILYFWGFGLCSQAFITPIVEFGPAHTRFWWFWIGHTHIVGSAIYDVIARGYRPSWSDFRIALSVSLVYCLALAVFNAFTGFNYGFVGPSKPGNATIIDLLGPYPWRIATLIAVATALLALLTLVWNNPWVRRASRTDA
jgi:hypothetical integral membrane protein (TIGR02206 family)